MEKLIEVRNRDCGYVGYTIKDRGVWRSFAPGETKKISLDELQALQYVPGGEYTLKHLLMVKDTDALSILNIETEPEYFYTETEIKELLLTGTLEQLQDCLDFAPEGVIEIIKKMAVDLEIPDIRKREAITNKTGFNISNAIMVNKVMEEDSSDAQPIEETKTRRTAPIAASTTGRRTELPKYNVVKTSK